MTLLFDIAIPSPTSKVGDTDFKEYFPAINKDMSWYSLEPYIRQATDKYIVPLIGMTFYESVATYEAEEGETENTYMILTREKMKDIVAWYAVWLAMPHINRVLSDLGVQQNSSENSNSSPTEMWRYKNARWETMLHADSLLDALMLYIEDNRNELIGWTATLEYHSVGHPLFRTTRIWGEYSNLLSYRAYKAVQPYIRQAVDIELINATCKELYDDLVTKYLASQLPPPQGQQAVVLTAYEEAAFNLMRKMTANYALHRALPHLRITFESNALLIVSSTDGMNIKQAALQEAITSLSQRLKNDGDTYKGMLQKYLLVNIEEFPDLEEAGYMLYPQKRIISSSNKVGGIMLT